MFEWLGVLFAERGWVFLVCSRVRSSQSRDPVHLLNALAEET